MKTFGLLITAFLFLFGSSAFSQIPLSKDSIYTQDFNTLVDSGSSSVLPDGWHFLENGTVADDQYIAGTGSSKNSNTYSLGEEDSTERALGSIAAISLSPTFGANFINNTGEIISILNITYYGEQWRLGENDRKDSLIFKYSIDADSLTDGNWTRVDELSFISPNVSASIGALNGNLSENRRVMSFVITGLSILPGSSFWIKWEDKDVYSYDDALAVDDFQISVTTPSISCNLTPSSLNFDTVKAGISKTLPVTIENQGTTGNLEISDIVSSNPAFTCSENNFPVIITPGNTRIFNITFRPAGEGDETGTINFTNNAPSGSAVLAVDGAGKVQDQKGLLKFKTNVRNLLDGTTANQDTIILSGYSGQPLKALQFNLIIGNSNGRLILRSVSRGTAIPAGQFNFNYEIYHGSFLPDGSSIDTVKVVILGNSSNAIMSDTGSQEIIKLSYDIVSISGITAQTFNKISFLTGATVAPVNDAGISAGGDETINIFNGTREGLLGDVNLDDQVNILDILLMVDNILGRADFSSSQFINGDISPWNSGDPLPVRDGIIDVLDLAVLQNIVLTGAYPDNTPVYKTAHAPVEFAGSKMHKLTPGMNAKVTFYFTDEGISVGLESSKKIKGLQIELSKAGLSISQNTKLTSLFNQADFFQNNSCLRILSYDDQCGTLDAGEYIIASIPASDINPEDIVVDNVIVADENNNAMQNVEVDIQYGDPSVPLDYTLSQNYPNPFNPATSIKFSIPNDEYVTIKVYDIIGQEIATLFSGNAKTGIHTLNWNGRDQNGNKVSSGSYICRMTAGEFTVSKKMMYIK